MRDSALVTHGTFLGPGPTKFQASLHEVLTCLSTPKLVVPQETFMSCRVSQQGTGSFMIRVTENRRHGTQECVTARRLLGARRP